MVPEGLAFYLTAEVAQDSPNGKLGGEGFTREGLMKAGEIVWRILDT